MPLRTDASTGIEYLFPSLDTAIIESGVTSITDSSSTVTPDTSLGATLPSSDLIFATHGEAN